MLHPLALLPLLLLLFPSTASASHRPFDWHDCATQACYVADSCKLGVASRNGKLLLVASEWDVVTPHHDCIFAMLIRPFSTSAWLVRLRVKLPKQTAPPRITLTRNNAVLHECIGSSEDGSVRVSGADDLLFVPHADSHHTLHGGGGVLMHCVYTVAKRDKTALDTSRLTIVFGDNKKKLTLDKMENLMKYLSCEGSEITMSSVKPAPADAVAVPVDISRAALACPAGDVWKLMIETDGALQEARAARCVKWGVAFGYRLDMVKEAQSELEKKFDFASKFNAVCVAENGCALCAAPRHESCPHCARVRLRPGNDTHCATLTCAAADSPNKFLIANSTYMGEAVCAPRSGGGGFGWSISDASGKSREFDTAACVNEVSCHESSPLRLDVCEDVANCTKPIPFDSEDGESVVCAHDLIMRFRANASTQWAGADELICDPRKGRWSADAGPTILSPNTTVECYAAPDHLLIHYSIAALVIPLLICAAFLPYYAWSRKSMSEFDKNQRELSRKFYKIKEYPKSPEKSERETSVQRSPEKVDQPIVDTRIYPDELTIKRKKKSKKKKDEKSRGPVEYLRPRELDDRDRADAHCKSARVAGKSEWEKWIEKDGGIVRDKKPREEVLRLRAEKKAAKERRLEEERQAKLQKQADDRAKEEESTKKAAFGTGGGGKAKDPSLNLATDKFLMQKKAEVEDRFITIGPPPPDVGAALVGNNKKEPRKYKQKSGGSKEQAPIKFEAPETSDASILNLPDTDKRVEVFVTATEEHASTDARDKTSSIVAPRSGDDRAVESGATSKMKSARMTSQQSNKVEAEPEVAVTSTEDERRKKKRKEKKRATKKKSGTTEPALAKTAIGDDPAEVDVELQHNSKKKGVTRTTPLMMSPPPLTPMSATSTNTTNDTKRKRKKIRCFESKGEPKGIDKLRRRKKEMTAQAFSQDAEKKE